MIMASKRKIQLATILCCVSGLASAEWTYYADGNVPFEYKAYIDKDSIVREGDKVTAWILSDNKKKSPFDGTMSNKTLQLFDCKNETQYLKHVFVTDGHMGEGKVIFDDYVKNVPEKILPNSVPAITFKLLCR